MFGFLSSIEENLRLIKAHTSALGKEDLRLRKKGVNMSRFPNLSSCLTAKILLTLDESIRLSSSFLRQKEERRLRKIFFRLFSIFLIGKLELVEPAVEPIFS